MGRKALTNKTHLTDLELKVMNIIWKLRSATVQDIAEKIEEDLAYTTLSTVCRLLENQKILESVKNGRSHIYVPILQREEYEATAVENVVRNVFGNEPTAMVKRLIETDKLSASDRHELWEILAARAELN